MLDRIADGRTDLVFDYLAAGHPAGSRDSNGVSLLEWCAYYGDVSALRLLLSHGESLRSLGEDHGLINASFHGHWRLCQFLIESGADANYSMPDTGETPLHSALCTADSPAHGLIVKVLLAAGANPDSATKPGAETGCFMRDIRTRGETPLHRAAAFAGEETIQFLLDAGATIDARDCNGDSPLTWASWHLRPSSILRKLCYGKFRIRPDYRGMDANLRGEPHS
ncbi:MAG TPA: ankyrin repeat domain-containing protein [Bryobacteraceae bacterium]|nr:ankyrin repeat domain-containing protein [Bryobacteraceae bacterium]